MGGAAIDTHQAQAILLLRMDRRWCAAPPKSPIEIVHPQGSADRACVRRVTAKEVVAAFKEKRKAEFKGC